MSNFDKIKRILLIVLILGGIFASWSFGINEFSAMLENANDAQVRSAESQCAEYNVPHALVADGVAYCYMTHEGSEKMIPLEVLRELYDDPNTSAQ